MRKILALTLCAAGCFSGEPAVGHRDEASGVTVQGTANRDWYPANVVYYVINTSTANCPADPIGDCGGCFGDGTTCSNLGTAHSRVHAALLGGRVFTLTWDDTQAAGAKLVKFGGPLGAVREAGDLYGTALAAADVNADGYDDLAVGSPETQHAGRAGAVYMALGGASTFHDLATVRQPSSVTPTAGDRFGEAVAFGDFDGGGAELVSGTPGKHGTKGTLFVMHLSYSGSTYNGYGSAWKQIDQGSYGEVADDQFGQVLAVANFDGDAYDDLVVGVPEKQVSNPGTLSDGGAVILFRGSGSSSTYLTAANRYLKPSSYGSPGEFDHFGSAVAAGNFDAKANAPIDLAMGAVGWAGHVGEMWVARGASASIPVLSTSVNPTQAGWPASNAGFWTHFNEESQDRR
jgi:FG-GAP repeat